MLLLATADISLWSALKLFPWFLCWRCWPSWPLNRWSSSQVNDWSRQYQWKWANQFHFISLKLNFFQDQYWKFRHLIGHPRVLLVDAFPLSRSIYKSIVLDNSFQSCNLLNVLFSKDCRSRFIAYSRPNEWDKHHHPAGPQKFCFAASISTSLLL